MLPGPKLAGGSGVVDEMSRAFCCALRTTWLRTAGDDVRRKQRQATCLLQVGLCGPSRAGLQSCCLVLAAATNRPLPPGCGMRF